MSQRSSKRSYCKRCLHPQSTCYCDFVSKLDNHLQILILRHPKEKKQAYQTAHMSTLVFPNIQILDAEYVEDNQLFQSFIKKGSHLLFPLPSALEVEKLQNRQKIQRLILVDGTWRQAKKIITLNPSLKNIPCLKITTPFRSKFSKLRKSCDIGGLSTIEAISYVLDQIEPNQNRISSLPIEGLSLKIEQLKMNKERI